MPIIRPFIPLYLFFLNHNLLIMSRIYHIMAYDVICRPQSRDRKRPTWNIARYFIRYSTHPHPTFSSPLSDTDSIIREAAFRPINVQSGSLLRMKWIVLRMKILQNNIFASPKCRTSRMILPQISTITATDEYPECRIHEISEAVFVRKNTY